MSAAGSYRADLELDDGTAVVLRAIRPADRGALRAAFHRLSAESIALRFLQPKSDLSDAELSYFAEPDFEEHVALVATVGEGEGEEIIGVGRYIVLGAAAQQAGAELALAVIDDYQGHGVGTALLEHLAEIAVEHGVERFEADVLVSNRRVLKVFEHSGYEAIREHVGGGILHVTLPLATGGRAKGDEGA